MASSEAGPSRRKRGNSASDDEFFQDLESRPKKSLRERIFAPEDLELKIRLANRYRDMQSQADDMRVNMDNVQPEDLQKLMAKSNVIFRSVHDPSSANLDARLLQTTTETAGHLIRKMKLTGATFDIAEFLMSVKSVLGLDRQEADDMDAPSQNEEDEDELEEDRLLAQRRKARKGHLGDWEKIGWMAAQMNRRVPGVEFMYGPLEVEHKKRVATQRRKRKEIAPETRLGGLEENPTAKPSKDPTTFNVRSVMQALQKMDPEENGVRYLELVINPNDFAQTVENMFYTSFLIKDGMVSIEVLDDGDIIIRAREPHDPDVDGPVRRFQAVMEFDMAMWEDAIDLFNITESAIPHRAPAPIQPGANGWYGQ